MIGLAITLGAIAGLVWLIVWLYRGGKRMEEDLARRLLLARPGRAKVTRAESTGSTEGPRQFPLVRVGLLVTPSDGGGAPYDAETAWVIDPVAVPRVQPGCDVAVKIDAADPGLVYPDEGWAKYNPALAQFAMLGRRR